jgi:release factor glutamine methyltransferase
MGPDDVRRIRAWHERAYTEAQQDGAQEQSFDYLGLTVVVPPQVHPVTPVSHLLGDVVLAEARPGLRVLDMGAGSGVNGLLAASRGAEVVAVDVNPFAVEATVRNARRNGLDHLIDVRHGDVFDAVPERFDLIVFDPPFRWFTPRDLLEAASTDEDSRVLRRVLEQAAGGGPGGADLDRVPGQGGQPTLGHLGAAGVVHADEQDGGLVGLERGHGF